MAFKSLILFFLTTLLTIAEAQDPKRFETEVLKLIQFEYHFNENEEIVLFAGSSSIRLWNDLQSYFPDHQIIKNGFGGSQMSDLLYYADELILNYSPDKIFIYEGDNDIAEGKSICEIMIPTIALVRKIKQKIPAAEIFFISAKPSITRWSLKEKYESLNQKLKHYCQKEKNVSYVDVWTIMLDDKGNPKKEIFLEDSLHLNQSGYDLWSKEIAKFMNE